jgi:hypothetical protein
MLEWGRVAMSSGSTSERYKLSFSVGRLYLEFAPLAARLYTHHRDWAAVRSEIDASNLLQARTVSSAKRNSQELVQRLQKLTDSEVELLIDATADERAQLMWVATCRRYALIAEFAEEVLRERYLLMARDIQLEDFDAFLRGKALWHPELEKLANSTLLKLRSTLYLMMREADFITANGTIVPAIISARVRGELAKRTPSDLRLFATRETV